MRRGWVGDGGDDESGVCFERSHVAWWVMMGASVNLCIDIGTKRFEKQGVKMIWEYSAIFVIFLPGHGIGGLLSRGDVDIIH